MLLGQGDYILSLFSLISEHKTVKLFLSPKVSWALQGGLSEVFGKALVTFNEQSILGPGPQRAHSLAQDGRKDGRDRTIEHHDL